MTEQSPAKKSLDAFKKEVTGDKIRIHPQTTLDFQALDVAVEQYEEAQRNKQLREWLIYQAPPGVYDLFIKEREKQVQLMLKRNKIGLAIWTSICLFMVGLAGYQIYQVWSFIKP